jgi:hypothetical protein
MSSSILKQAGGFLLLFATLSLKADGWVPFDVVTIPNMHFGTAGAQLATDGTNLVYSTVLDGVWRANLGYPFASMPLTGFPQWDPNTNTNGFAVSHVAFTPQGTLVLSGTPVNLIGSTLSPPVNPLFNNPLPVFYWWDETNQLWHAALVTGKTYPYTANVGNFSIAPDGSLWSCSGYAPYAYRSLDGGHSYTAFDINARVPANYFPIPFTTNQLSFGKVFSIAAGLNQEVVIGTETGGFLHTTNNGLKWTSLDPNFTSTNSLNPLGRLGDANVAGLSRSGDFLGGGGGLAAGFPGATNWTGVNLIGYHPADGSYYPATNGFILSSGLSPGRVVTTPAGVSLAYLNQNYLLQGGVYRSADGKNWTQFNQGNGLDQPLSPSLTNLFATSNVLAAGNCLTTLGNLVYIGNGNEFYSYDSTPPPVTNRPPVALAQNLNLRENTSTNVVLTGYDADGDPLNVTITTPPTLGNLAGSPPNLTYTPSNNVGGIDNFYFQVDDGMATSAPVMVLVQIVGSTNLIPSVTLSSSARQTWLLADANLTLSATASDALGINQVNFYNGTNPLAHVVTPPYTWTVTNLTAGNYTFNARAVDHQEGSAWAPPLTLVVLPAAPQATIQLADATDVTLTWPLGLDGFYIETATNASGPWSLSPIPSTYLPTGQTATIPLTDQQFFRLMQP